MTTLARSERHALADLLDEVGPDAPTLCEGWAARDLAAHLVLRERRPDAAVGIIVGPLAGYTESVQRRMARGDYARLVSRVRSGPPLVPDALDKQFNTVEYFVHHEDVRRALPDWEPRELPAGVQEALWRALKAQARGLLRNAGVGVVLERPDGVQQVARAGAPAVTVVGEPAELLLFAFGRGEHARVELQGDDTAQGALRSAGLGV